MNANVTNETLNSKCIRKLETGNYEIGTLLFKVEMYCLFDSTGKEINLDYQQAKLLKMFLEASDHFLNKENTIDELWEDAKEAACRNAFYNRFNMSIKRLRNALSADKDIELLCKTKKGYKLLIKKRTSKKE